MVRPDVVKPEDNEEAAKGSNPMSESSPAKKGHSCRETRDSDGPSPTMV